MKPSNTGSYIIRQLVGSFWQYATKRTEKVKLGLSGSCQAIHWSYDRHHAKVFKSRRAAEIYLGRFGEWYRRLEIVAIEAPLVHRKLADEVWNQGELF